MRKKFFIVVIVSLACVILSGCAGVNEQTTAPAEQYQQQPASGSYSAMLDAQLNAQKKVDAARDKVQEAQERENNKINEVMEENKLSAPSGEKPAYSGAIIKTNMGNIAVKFYTEDSPMTVNNFVNLARNNFYDGTKFHRVISGFMIQGGDPNSKDDDWKNDGTGGPGYAFKDEINSRKLVKGSLAMANSGPNTNGSQFFIVTAESTPWLDGKHTNFGEVTAGLEVVEKIEKVKTNENDHPVEDVVINAVELVK